MGLKFCPYCGSQLKEGYLFCGECGKRIKDETLPDSKVIPTTCQESVSQISKRIDRSVQGRLQTKEKTERGLETFLERQVAAEVRLPSREAVEIRVKINPPPTAVKTVRDLIIWEYAKLIAHAAKLDGNYRFIMSRYMKLKKGEMKWASPDDDAKDMMVRGERTCIYCGSTEVATQDHIIPKCKGGPDIPANIVPACKSCNSSKLDKDIFEWYFLDRKSENIPRKVWSRYLKLVWEFHTLHRTLDRADINMDGKLDIQDIGAVFKRRT